MNRGMRPPSSSANLLLRAAVDVRILRAFSIDRWDLGKQVGEKFKTLFVCVCQGASSGGDASNLRMFTWLKMYAKHAHIFFVDTQSDTSGMMVNYLAGGESVVAFFSLAKQMDLHFIESNMWYPLH